MGSGRPHTMSGFREEVTRTVDPFLYLPLPFSVLPGVSLPNSCGCPASVLAHACTVDRLACLVIPWALASQVPFGGCAAFTACRGSRRVRAHLESPNSFRRSGDRARGRAEETAGRAWGRRRSSDHWSPRLRMVLP